MSRSSKLPSSADKVLREKVTRVSAIKHLDDFTRKRKICLHWVSHPFWAATSLGGHPICKVSKIGDTSIFWVQCTRELLSGYLSLTARKPETSRKSRFVRPQRCGTNLLFGQFFPKMAWQGKQLVECARPWHPPIDPPQSTIFWHQQKQSGTFFRRQYRPF